MDFLNDINVYIKDLENLLEKIDRKEINILLNDLLEARNNKKNVFLFGNGGSGSTASHFTSDLNKGTARENSRFKGICLNDNIPIVLAYANDEGYDKIFVEQLKNFIEPGDLVIGISASGNSSNVVKAIEYANSMGAKTFGICGYEGGKLKQLAHKSIHVKSKDMQKIEDVHLIIAHLLTQIINSNLK